MTAHPARPAAPRMWGTHPFTVCGEFTVHVTPEWELDAHDPDHRCPCSPEIRLRDDRTLVIHHQTQ